MSDQCHRLRSPGLFREGFALKQMFCFPISKQRKIRWASLQKARQQRWVEADEAEVAQRAHLAQRRSKN